MKALQTDDSSHAHQEVGIIFAGGQQRSLKTMIHFLQNRCQKKNNKLFMTFMKRIM